MAEDETEPVKEINYYKQALDDARTAIQAEVDTFAAAGGPGAGIVKHVATNGGWACSEADTWVEDVSGRCDMIGPAFQSALDEVDGLWSNQPDEVPENNWRGLAYRSR